MQKNVLISVAVIVLLAVAGGSFYGGMIYGKSQRSMPSFGNGNFQGTKSGNANGGSGMASGEITAKDGNSITLKTQNGGSKIIFYSSTTTVSKSTSGTTDDLATGTNISVTGTAGSDGSITAKSIQLMPAGIGAQSGQPGGQSPANN